MSITIAIQKLHKDDYLMTKKYWPIVLLDTIRKALESVLVKKISTPTKFHSFLSKTYFGSHCGT